MTAFLACCLGLLAAPQDSPLPRELSLEEPRTVRVQETPQERPVQPLRPARTERPFIDLDWLEVTPGAGMAFFSSNFLADPAPCFAIRAHAPMPWLNPPSDPIGEYFGLFAEVELTTIDRKMSPAVTDRSGLITMFSVGVDFSFVRDGAWILMARVGAAYVHYGSVADLQNGIGPLIGLTVGYELSGKLALTYSPEMILGDTGSRIFMNTLGLLIHF